jgi:ubiquitin C-terminal hydrolase
MKQCLPASTSDIVVAATSINVDLSADATSRLRIVLQRCFPANYVVINEGADGAASSLLVNWVRAWVDIAAVGRAEATSNMFGSKKTKRNHVDTNVMLLCGTLFDHGQSEACCVLLPHISQGKIFNQEPAVVLNFIQVLIHGHRILDPLMNVNIYRPMKNFLVDILRRVPKPYPKDLKEYARASFDQFGTVFDYCSVSFILQKKEASGLQERKVVEVLRFTSSGPKWQSLGNDIEIFWSGTNWKLKLSGHVVALQEVKGFYKGQCIPRLGCLQSSGKWTSVVDCLSNVQVTLASESNSDVVLDQQDTTSFRVISDLLGPVFPWQSMTPADKVVAGAGPLLLQAEMSTTGSAISSGNNVANLTLKVAVFDHPDHRSELRESNETRPHVTVPESVFSLLSPFLSWDPILNVFRSLESVSVSVLQDLLERCLWLWAGRNSDFEEMQEFYTSAIQSLNVYEGKGSLGDSGWKPFFEKYGCYETSRLWTLKERLMLMVACSWPVYYWGSIDQKKSTDSATRRIRGMALLHPVFTQFLRSRMLDLGFINDEDFPPQFSHFSAVNICSNVCRHGLSKLGWNNVFMIDFSVSLPFLRLTGCSEYLNADGLYAATSVTVNGTRVYAIVNSDMHTKLQGSGILVGTSAEIGYTDPKLDHATVILVTVRADSAELQLESVKFAFALNLQEFILMRVGDMFKRFFTVSFNDDAFIYIPMPAPPLLAAVPFTSKQSKNSPLYLYFNFGHCLVPVSDPIKSTLQKEQLSDQACHFYGIPKLSFFFGIQDVSDSKEPQSQNSRVVSMYGLCPPPSWDQSVASGTRQKKRVKSSDESTITISRSALYAVFHDTFIGVRIGSDEVCIKIKDGCGFLFSFGFEHFQAGTVKWNFLPHSYFHSKDIRHFPVDTPEHFLVLMAATKLGKMCNDPLSLAAFEVMILQTLNTYRGTDAESSASVYSGLNGVVVKESIGNFYSLLSHGAVLPPAFPVASNNAGEKALPESSSGRKTSLLRESRMIVSTSSAAGASSGPPINSNHEKADLTNPNFVGLRNPSLLCPFNSLIQAWFCIQGFRNIVLLSKSEDQTLIELKILFYFLQIRRRDCCAKEFAVSPCFITLSPGLQHDVDEIFMLLYDYLHASVVFPFMKDHFQGKCHRETKVQGDNNHKEENFSHLSVGVSCSVETSIMAFFASTDVNFEFSEAADAAAEKVIVPATTQLSIAALPSVLHVHLKRFDLEGNKIFDKCTFSDELDLSDYVEPLCNAQVRSTKYFLQSVLVHTGSKSDGHYIVYTRPDVEKDVWWCFDDHKPVVKVNKEQAIDANFGQGTQFLEVIFGNSQSSRPTSKRKQPQRSLSAIPTAYMLIYVRDTAIVDLLSAPPVDVDLNLDLLGTAHVILSRIEKLSDKSAEADPLSFLRLVDNYVCSLTSIFRVVFSDPSHVEVSKRMQRACDHLETIVDQVGGHINPNATFIDMFRNDKKAFHKRCDCLVSLCDKYNKKQFSEATSLHQPQSRSAAHSGTTCALTDCIEFTSTNHFPTISVLPFEANCSCADESGNIFVSCVHPTDSVGDEIQVFGNGNFSKPIRVIPNVCENSYGGFVLDNRGHLIIADSTQHCIRIFNRADGSAVRIIGSPGSKGSGKNHFNRPMSVAWDPDGNVVVHDTGNNRLQVHRVQDGIFIRTVYQKKQGKFFGAGSVVFDSVGNLVFSDDDRCIRVLDYKTGELIHKLTVPADLCCDKFKGKGIRMPGGLATDKSGNIFMVHLHSNRLLVFREGSLIHNSNIPIPPKLVDVKKFQEIWQSRDEAVRNIRVTNVAMYKDQLMYCYQNIVYVCPMPNLSSSVEVSSEGSTSIINVSDTGDNATDGMTNAPRFVPVAATLNAVQSAASINQYLCGAAISAALSCFQIMAPSICGFHILFVPPLISWKIINHPDSENVRVYKEMVSGCSMCVFVTGLGEKYDSHGSHWLLHFYDIASKKCFCWDSLTEDCQNITENQRVNVPFSSFLWDAKSTATYSFPSKQIRVQYDDLHCGVWVLLYICHFMLHGHQRLVLTVDIETARRALATDLKNHRWCLDRFISCVERSPKVKSVPSTVPHSFWHELPLTSMENYLLLKYKQTFVFQSISRNKLSDASEDNSIIVSNLPTHQRLVTHYRSTLNGGIVTVYHLGLIVDGEISQFALSPMYEFALSKARGKDGSFGIIAVGSTCSWVHVCLPICPNHTLESPMDGKQTSVLVKSWNSIWKNPIEGLSNSRDTRCYEKHLNWLFNTSMCDSRWNTLIFSWNLNVFKGCLSPIVKCIKREGLKHNVGFTQPFLKMIRCNVSVVEDAETFTECLTFIKSTRTISFDTERSVVVPNSKEPIDLLQVGTHDQVFLIRVNWCAAETLRQLELALSNCDTLFHWGGEDDVKLRRLFDHGIDADKFVNVQNLYSPRNSKTGSYSAKPGLYSAAHDEFNPYFKPCSTSSKKTVKVTEEDWTMSGWNIPSLTPEQIGYAGLDVALLNILSQHHSFPLFQSDDVYTGFLDAFGNYHWHGCLKSPSSQVFGHFISGHLEKGFETAQQNKLSFIGFQIDSSTNFVFGHDFSDLQSIVTEYFKLLNNKRFCCYYCSIIIDTHMQSLPTLTIVKMQTTDTRFTVGKNVHKCPSGQQNLSDCASWLCFTAVSCLFGSAVMPTNFLSLVDDDVRGGFLRLSLSPFSQGQN